MMKYLFLLIIVSIATIVNAQESNVFLNRDYWKANPSIEEVNKEIENGNSVSELDRYDFDAVSWAILEDVDNSTIKEMILMDGNGAHKITHDGRSYVFWAAYKNIADFAVANGPEGVRNSEYAGSFWNLVEGSHSDQIYVHVGNTRNAQGKFNRAGNDN